MQYLVIGPESSGTHYMLDLLRMNVRRGDLVHHRSLPLTYIEGDPRQEGYHGPRREVWPNPDCLCRSLGRPEDVRVIICLRHPAGTKNGQLRMGWSRDEEEASQKLARAWGILGRFMSETTYPYVISTYESLDSRETRASFLSQLGITLKKDKEFVNGNSKYWTD